MFEAPLQVEGKVFTSAEHAYQYAKVEDAGAHAAAEAILNTLCPCEAKSIGNKVKPTAEWSNRSEQVMLPCTPSPMHFFSTGRQKDKYSGIKLRIEEHNLSEVDDYKYLGTILDSKWTGEKQYNQVVGKVAVKLATFRCIRYLIKGKENPEQMYV